MKRINYNSDFDFRLAMAYRAADGSIVKGVPPFDFVLRYHTDASAKSYIVSQKDGVMKNCFAEGDMLHVVMASHGLMHGVLKHTQIDYIPNSIYPNGTQRLVLPESLDIELVTDAGDDYTDTITLELMAPYIKGEPFRYEDFTDEQLDDLRRPATEAAIEAMRSAGHAEEEAGRARQAAAQATEATESMRETEAAVADAEAMREAAEGIREEAESKRIIAEKQRAKTFAGMRDELADKPDRSELSNIMGQPTEKHIASVEETIITDALRKTAQVLTPQEQEQVKKNLAISKMELFCDQLNAAVGKYGYARLSADMEFDCEINKLKLTYEEAMEVYNDGTFDTLASAGKIFSHRTNLPIKATHNIGTIEQSFSSDDFKFDVEVAQISSLNTSNPFSAYPISIYHKPFGSAKLIEILGVIDFHFARAKINWFVGAVNLREVRISRLAWSIDLSSCALLSLESFAYLVREAYTNPGSNHNRVVTVHPEVYAKLVDESNADWHKVMTDGAAKNIIFATI